MKRIGLITVGLLLTISLVAQKQINDPNAEVRNVKSFHAIKVSHGIELFLTPGNSEAVAVSATEVQFRDKIKTVVENGVLKIYFDTDFWKNMGSRKNYKLKAYVSYRQINGIDASSGSSVKVEGSIKASSLALETSSGAVFSGKVEVPTLKVDQSSGSVINISGSVTNLTVEGSSGSVFHGYDLIVDNCNAETSSGSGVQVSVNKELTAEASSGGHVSYKGSGVIRSKSTSSGGNVSKKG